MGTEENDKNEYHWILNIDDNDPAWDQFLLESSSGHYSQSALWGQAKKAQGWMPFRMQCFKENRIVGGAQILGRKIPLLGWMGYVTKGPVYSNGNLEKTKALTGDLLKKCRQSGFFYLAVQPPDNGDHISRWFQEFGFKSCTFGNIEKPATILIDLRPDLDRILAGIKPHKRDKIRLSQKNRIVYREGSEQDLPVFIHLFHENGKRNQFETESEDYIYRLWQTLSPQGHIHILLAEIDGEVITAQLNLIYKNRYYGYRTGWSGKYRNLYPNDGLFWYGIKWAKEHGCDWFDLGGVDTAAFEAIQKGESPITPLKGTYSEYKLHYSENVVLFPQTYDRLLLPGLGWVCDLFRSQKTLRMALKKVYRTLRRR